VSKRDEVVRVCNFCGWTIYASELHPCNAAYSAGLAARQPDPPKLTIDTSDPETKAIWESAKRGYVARPDPTWTDRQWLDPAFREAYVKERLREAQPDPNNVGFPPGHRRLYNACTEPCDMLVGPCACGAWHHWDDWKVFVYRRDLRPAQPAEKEGE
jgi:hypothetical protein